MIGAGWQFTVQYIFLRYRLRKLNSFAPTGTIETHDWWKAVFSVGTLVFSTVTTPLRRHDTEQSDSAPLYSQSRAS